MEMATREDIVGWFKRWRKPLRQWLHYRSNVPTATLDDLAQEVFLRLLRYTDNDIPIDNPQAYLFRIASNVANEWSERHAAKKAHDADWLDDLIAGDDDEPEHAAEGETERQFITDEVMKLPARQRGALLLHVVDGLTYVQIASRLQCSPRMVLRDLTRAYSTMRMTLSPVREDRHMRRNTHRNKSKWQQKGDDDARIDDHSGGDDSGRVRDGEADSAP